MPEVKKNTKVYTPVQVAQFAHCTPQTVYRHLDAINTHPNDPPVFPNARRIGRRKWIIPEEDAIAFIGYNPAEESVELVK